jgi:hypothetical protein
MATVSCARVERAAVTGQDKVEATLSADPGRIRAAVGRLIRSPGSGGRYRRFSVAGKGEEYFPAEFQLAHYRQSSSLGRYLSIPPEAREHDLYLYDFSDSDDVRSYWHSEYSRSGRPVAFRCDFLIHVEPAGPGSSRVEIFEYVPRVWLGKKLAWGPHGPGFHLDVQEVEPTTRDRVELLDALRGELR